MWKRSSVVWLPLAERVALTPDDGPESGPVPMIRPYDGVRLEGLALARLNPSVPLVHGRGMLVAAHRLHVLQQGLLVALTVYGNHLCTRLFSAALQSRRPLREQPLEMTRVDGLEHVVDGVVGRYAVGQDVYPLQFLMMSLAEQLYDIKRIRAAYHGQDAQHQYVRQRVRAAADHPRVAQPAEYLVHLCHGFLPFMFLQMYEKYRNKLTQNKLC